MSSVPIQRKEGFVSTANIPHTPGADCASAPDKLTKRIKQERDPYVLMINGQKHFDIRQCCSAFYTEPNSEPLRSKREREKERARRAEELVLRAANDRWLKSRRKGVVTKNHERSNHPGGRSLGNSALY